MALFKHQMSLMCFIVLWLVFFMFSPLTQHLWRRPAPEKYIPFELHVVIPNLENNRVVPDDRFTLFASPRVSVYQQKYVVREAQRSCSNDTNDLSVCWDIDAPGGRHIVASLRHPTSDLKDIFFIKARQMAHIASIMGDICQRGRDKKGVELWYLLADDDVVPCLDSSIYMPFILDFASKHQAHIAALRVGLGTSGVMMNATMTCALHTYLAAKIWRNARVEDKSLSAYAIDDQMDYFLGGHHKEYFAFHHNLLFHDFEKHSTILGNGHLGWREEHTTYGMCRQPLYWPGERAYAQRECKHHAFSPCKPRSGVFVPLVEEPSECEEAAIAPVKVAQLRVVVGRMDQSCVHACLDNDLQCVPQFVDIINRESLLRSMECDTFKVDISHASPGIGPSNLCFERSFRCLDLSRFCNATTQRFRRICPCSV